jgi:hypothetical protein
MTCYLAGGRATYPNRDKRRFVVMVGVVAVVIIVALGVSTALVSFYMIDFLGDHH